MLSFFIVSVSVSAPFRSVNNATPIKTFVSVHLYHTKALNPTLTIAEVDRGSS